MLAPGRCVPIWLNPWPAIYKGRRVADRIARSRRLWRCIFVRCRPLPSAALAALWLHGSGRTPRIQRQAQLWP